MRLVLYDKPGCHLCAAALQVVERVVAGLAGVVDVALERFDVRRDPALQDLYRHDVPVLAIDGVPAFRHHVDPARLEARLLRGVPAPLEEAP